MEYTVLDKGFLRVVDTMGDDQRIVDSARVSYMKGTKKKNSDAKLIDYLIRNDHGSPLEMVEFAFHVKTPIFVARQWFRHRIGEFNEVSLRYSEAELDFYVPTQWRGQDTKNRQGSSGEITDPDAVEECNADLDLAVSCSVKCYEDLLLRGVSREMARIVLPANLYTQFYWKVNGRSLANFIKLRCAPNAQYEIRQYADAIKKVFVSTCPMTAESLEKHVWSKKHE